MFFKIFGVLNIKKILIADTILLSKISRCSNVRDSLHEEFIPDCAHEIKNTRILIAERNRVFNKLQR
ncbi:MAG: hypothetical protein K8S14_01595 [Actinomycetia bacterium]|nr:hypothetical protein [Actinomycetes bacterium]